MKEDGFKGQLISKGLFVFFNSFKKRTKNFCPIRLDQKFKFKISFFGRFEDTKIEINGDLVGMVLCYQNCSDLL